MEPLRGSTGGGIIGLVLMESRRDSVKVKEVAVNHDNNRGAVSLMLYIYNSMPYLSLKEKNCTFIVSFSRHLCRSADI